MTVRRALHASRVGRACAVAVLVLIALSCREPAAPDVRGGAPAPPALPASARPRELARVVARHPLGVPLHDAPGSGRVVARLPDGAAVEVERRSEDQRWFLVRAAGVESGWVTRRYLDLGALFLYVGLASVLAPGTKDFLGAFPRS